MTRFFAFVSLLLSVQSNKHKRRLYTDDVELMGKYNIEAEDKLEACRFLTPVMVEKFVNLRDLSGIKKIKCIFLNNDVIMAVQSEKNFFEYGNLFSRLDNPQYKSPFYKDMRLFMGLMDYFGDV